MNAPANPFGYLPASRIKSRDKTPCALRTAPPQGANRRQFIQGATRSFAIAKQRNKTPCALSTPSAGPEAPLRRNRAEWKSDAKTPCALRNTASTARP